MDIEATEKKTQDEREKNRPKEKTKKKEILYRSNNIIRKREEDKKKKICVYRDDRLGIMLAVRHMKYSVDEIIK